MKIFCLLLPPLIFFAAPKGAVVEEGQARVTAEGPNTRIETSHRAVINWDTFSIGKGETTRFIQPSADSSVINRVASGMSRIDGLLQGNGRIYLLNPSGVLIGRTGVVSCAAFAASTLDFDSDSCFKGGDLLFKGSSKAGGIVNLGKIEALGGDVLLIARSIVNEGSICAEKGDVMMAAASELLLRPSGSQRLFIAPEDPSELKADDNVYRLAINHSGIVEASGIEQEGGKIFIVAQSGNVETSGALSAASGTVHLLGREVMVKEGAAIDVSGKGGGGDVFIGGDYQGSNPAITNAAHTIVEEGAHICADAQDQGDGGRVIIWGDESVAFRGEVTGRGGEDGGSGGFVEVSSPGHFDFEGRVDLSAKKGEFGELLLDPSEIRITTLPNDGVTGSTVVSATKPVANLNNTALGAQLALASVRVTTQSSFSQAGDIAVEAPITWASGSTLTLQVDNNIELLPMGTITPTGAGAVIVEAKGSFLIQDGGRIETVSGPLRINAARGILLRSGTDPAILSTMSGNIELNTNGALQLLSQTGAVEVDTVTGNLLINTSPSFSVTDVIIGHSGGIGSHLLASDSGLIRLSCSGNMHVIAPNTVGSSSQVFTGSGPSQFDIGGNLLVQGGGANGALAALGTRNGDVELTVGGDVQVLATGTGGAHALIGHYRRANEPTGAGRLRFTRVGGDVRVIGGPTTTAHAYLGSTPINGAGAWTFTGDVELSELRGDVEVRAREGSALIGFGNSTTDDTYTGNLTIDAQKTISVTSANTAGVLTSATIGVDPGTSATLAATMSQLNLGGQNVILNSANGNSAAIGYQATLATPTSDVTISNLQVSTFGPVVLNGGSGFSLIGAVTQMGTAVADSIGINASSVTLNGGTGAARVLGGSSVRINTGLLEVGVSGGNANSAEMFGAGQLLGISTGDVNLGGASFVHTDSGSLTLVADNNPSDPLKIGDGNFSLLSGATLTSGGPMRIFTSTRSGMTVEAPINGETFVPGPFLVNTSTEQWCTAFPDDFGGTPFTIFYKTCLPITTINENNRIFAEMFQKLHTYDELFFDWHCFLFGYDKACYDQLFHPRGMVSSFDLFRDELEYSLRQRYRNFELKHVESF